MFALSVCPQQQQSNTELLRVNIGWIISGVPLLLTLLLAVFLVFKHTEFYTNKNQQRHFIRMVLLIPVISCTALASLTLQKPQYTLYINLGCALFQAFCLYSFLVLVLQVVFDSPQAQKRGRSKDWQFDLSWKYPWLKFCYLQYVTLLPLFAGCAILLDVLDRYCLYNPSFQYGFMRLILTELVSLLLFHYAIWAIYATVKEELNPGDITKFYFVTLLTGLPRWQSLMVSLMAARGILSENPPFWSKPHIVADFTTLLICWEMLIFAIISFWAFGYGSFRPRFREHSSRQIRAMGDALNPTSFFCEVWNMVFCCGSSCIERMNINDKTARRVSLQDFARLMDIATTCNVVNPEPENEVDATSAREMAPHVRPVEQCYSVDTSWMTSSPMSPLFSDGGSCVSSQNSFEDLRKKKPTVIASTSRKSSLPMPKRTFSLGLWANPIAYGYAEPLVLSFSSSISTFSVRQRMTFGDVLSVSPYISSSRGDSVSVASLFLVDDRDAIELNTESVVCNFKVKQ